MSGNHNQPWRKGWLWKSLVRQVKSEESVCWICMGADFDPVPRTPFSASIDHVLGLEVHPELALERSNLRLAHYGCNSRRAALGNAVAVYEPSREW